MTLGEFLSGQLGNRAPWHCSTMPADWCVALGHPDFAAAWRGIDDAAECERLPIEAGGLLVLWGIGFGDVLPFAPGELAAGDIGVVRIAGFDAGGIWTGNRWALKAARGLHFIADDVVEVLGAWRP